MAGEFHPYVGPRPFERSEDDQKRFFGRGDEASELLSRITAHSAVLFYSQSGAGKTSLINAKLTPMLQKAGFEVLKPARVRDVPPEDSVLQQISNIYAFNVLTSWDDGMTNQEVLARMSISEFLKNRRGAVKEAEDGDPRVAIFDQFEELFTSFQERSGDREDFFDQVGAALEEDRLLRVVFAMREDYIAELDPYVAFLPEKLRTRYRIERLSEEDALLAIAEPLAGTEYSFAAGVAEQLVENLLMVPAETAKGVTKVRGDSVEPVQLQVVCQTLWENCQNTWRTLSSEKKVITREYLETFGDVDQALSTFYENAIRRVVQAIGVKEGVLRKWFEQSLITSAGTRGTVFRGQKETGDIPNAAVDELVNQHIIRGELRGGSRWYELTHDRFIAPIKASNERWFLAHSGGDQTPKRLQARAEQWVQDGRQKGDLFDEGELLEARRWLESPGASDVGYSEALFSLVQASRAASEAAARERERVLAQEQQRAAAAERERAKEQQRRLEVQTKSAKLLRWLTVALTLMFLFTLAALVLARKKQQEAQAKTAEAATQEKAAVDARTKLAEEQSARALEAAQAAQQKARELSTINKELDAQRQRAILQSQIAARNERRALIALKQAKELDRIKEEIKGYEGKASDLRAAQKVDEALALYYKILSDYKLTGDKAGQERTQGNIDNLIQQRPERR
jgi:preprotein translocase subunit SecG